MKRKFRDRILTCIDRGLDHLGESVKHVIYWHLENKLGLKKFEMADRPEEFIRELEEMYGSGIRIIEKSRVREIAKEFGIEADSLVEAVKKARKA